jgi:DNA-binding NtrC family response regulator
VTGGNRQRVAPFAVITLAISGGSPSAIFSSVSSSRLPQSLRILSNLERVCSDRTQPKGGWQFLHETLVETEFHISEAARRLGMHRRTLARKLAKRRVT